MSGDFVFSRGKVYVKDLARSQELQRKFMDPSLGIPWTDEESKGAEKYVEAKTKELAEAAADYKYEDRE